MKSRRAFIHGFFAKALALSFFCVLSFALTGCLSEGDNSSNATTTPTTTTIPPTAPTDMGFSGVNQVQDLDAGSIKISWLAASSSTVVSYRVYEIAGDGSATAIQTLDATKRSYVQTGLVLGSTHSYMVKAVNAYGAIDINTVIMSAFTFGGISSVTATDLVSATVHFTPSAALSSYNIYYRATRLGSGGAWTLAGSVSNPTNSYSVTNLNSGTTYSFKVTAVDSSGSEDTNTATMSAQTYSLSFYPPTPQTMLYKGPILVQAYGTASHAPAGTPSSRQVTIVWNEFNLIGNQSYALVRTAKGQVIDMTVTTACTPTTTTSCQVCTITGSSNQSCTDNNVGAPPAVYDYVVTAMSATNWPEELPTAISNTPFRITVPIPPDNMVLVHRDSVNYEQCYYLMGKTPDPLNHQRCQISGSSMLGSVPYNSNPGFSALNLNANYYDFGYNLFVNRWDMACNWTPSSSRYSNGTGMCGAGATSGDCFGTGAPAGTIGAVGNVYYATTSGTCYYKRDASTWVTSNDSSVTATEYNIMATSDPAPNGWGYRPPLVNINQTQSTLACNSKVDTYYGQKRLLRHREYIAAAAWPKIQGEPNAMNDTQIGNVEAAVATNPHTSAGGYQCNSASHKAIAAGNFTSTDLAGDIGNAIMSFNIGSIETSGCVSRFGLQDHVGNVWQWTSDQIYCSTASITTPYTINAHSCLGVASSVDSGNGHTTGFDMNGFAFDGVQGPGGTTGGQTGPNYTYQWSIASTSPANYNANYFNTALGLPLVGTDNGNALLISANTSMFHGDYFYLYSDNGVILRGLIAGGGNSYTTWDGRWFWLMTNSNTSAGASYGLRCAVPAE